MLNNLMQEDLMEASLFTSALGDKDEEESPADVAKLKISKVTDFTKSLEVVTFASTQLKNEVKEVVAAAKRVVARQSDCSNGSYEAMEKADAQLDDIL